MVDVCSVDLLMAFHVMKFYAFMGFVEAIANKTHIVISTAYKAQSNTIAGNEVLLKIGKKFMWFFVVVVGFLGSFGLKCNLLQFNSIYWFNHTIQTIYTAELFKINKTQQQQQMTEQCVLHTANNNNNFAPSISYGKMISLWFILQVELNSFFIRFCGCAVTHIFHSPEGLLTAAFFLAYFACGWEIERERHIECVEIRGNLLNFNYDTKIKKKSPALQTPAAKKTIHEIDWNALPKCVHV